MVRNESVPNLERTRVIFGCISPNRVQMRRTTSEHIVFLMETGGGSMGDDQWRVAHIFAQLHVHTISSSTFLTLIHPTFFIMFLLAETTFDLDILVVYDDLLLFHDVVFLQFLEVFVSLNRER